MATAFSSLSGIGYGLIKNILLALGIGVVAFLAYFITKFISKNSKKQKAFTIQAIIIDMNGVAEFDWLALVKSEESQMFEMQFKSRKADSMPPVPKHLIRNGYVMLLNFAPGHYCVIDTYKTIQNLKSGSNILEPYNLGMKKYITAKQREIMNKIESKKKNWELYAPWIVLTIGIVSAIFLAFLLFYVGAWLDAKNIASRMVECKKIAGMG